MSMAGKRSTTGSLRQPPGLGFRRRRGCCGDGSRRLGMQQDQQAVAFRLEADTKAVADRRAVAELHPARIPGHAVDPELVVEVRAGGEAGGSYVPDGLSLFDPRARVNTPREAAKMAVAGRNPIPVAQLDQVAIATGPTGAEHDAVTGGHDRRPRRGRVVGALVPPGDTQHRMKPGPGEARRDAAELHRGAEERAAERVPAAVV